MVCGALCANGATYWNAVVQRAQGREGLATQPGQALDHAGGHLSIRSHARAHTLMHTHLQTFRNAPLLLLTLNALQTPSQ